MIPQVELTDKGVIVPSVQELIDGLWVMFKDAFGSNLNTAMSTPQGQLVTSLAAIIQDERNQWVEFLNQFDPRYSRGVWQDGIGYIYFMTRKAETHSIAKLTLVGLPGVLIKKGMLFQDENGRDWETLTDITIDSSGKAIVDIQSVIAGSIEAKANSITTIKTSIYGLDRVYNEYQAITGTEAESRNDFELRRYESVAINSKNTNAATYGAVSNIADVVDTFVVDNPSDESITVGSTNYQLIRNSILVSVVGGDQTEIAKTILAKAGTGCSFVGNTEVTVVDDENFDRNPPEYKVKFLRPSNVQIYFQVQLSDKGLMSYADEIAIKEAIEKAFLSGTTRARIGQKIIASKFICSVANAVTNLDIVSLQISKSGSDYVDFIDVGVDEFPSTNQYLIKVI